MLYHTQTSCVIWTEAQPESYLALSASRQEGRYLSNRMVRLAFSDWTSRLSIQLDTGGFQPRSAGLMYKIPGRKDKENRLWLLLVVQHWSQSYFTSERAAGVWSVLYHQQPLYQLVRCLHPPHLRVLNILLSSSAVTVFIFKNESFLSSARSL